MSDIDVERVSSLLSIAEKCTGHSGKLSNLQSWAIGQLISINADIKAQATADAKAAAEAQQKTTGLPEEPGVEPETPPPDDTNTDTVRRL
jgi:hypothetical protein